MEERERITEELKKELCCTRCMETDLLRDRCIMIIY